MGLLDELPVLLALLSPLLLLLSVLPELPELLEECRLLAMVPVSSTTVLASVRLMLSLRLMPMLSTELDTLLPLLLLLEDIHLPPTATPRPRGCATPGVSRLPARSPTLFVCLSPSATPSPGRS